VVSLASDLKDLLINLIAALIGAVAGYLFGLLRRKLRERALSKAVCKFFGLPGKVLIVHSAVFDKPEKAWNYPATDTKAARRLARLFESLGLHEGTDFTISPDRRVKENSDLWSQNLILLCGPMRNKIFQLVASDQRALRYTMLVGEDGRNVLTDTERKYRLRSSRESGADSGKPYDWGMVTSFVNPRNSSRRIVLLAGIHGTGTVGAVEYVTELANLKRLISRSDDHSISEVIRVDYEDDIETPTNSTLV
jgi:hypothetical protein